MRALLPAIEAHLANKRVYHLVVNFCILVAVLASVAWRVSPDSEWIAGAVATISALVALATYFVSLRSTTDSNVAGTEVRISEASSQGAPEPRRKTKLATDFEVHTVELHTVEPPHWFALPRMMKGAEVEPVRFLSVIEMLGSAVETQQAQGASSPPIELTIGDLKITVAAGEAKLSRTSAEKSPPSSGSSFEPRSTESPDIVRKIVH